MANEKTPLAAVEFTPEFKRNLRVLAKKYRNVRADIQPVIERIQQGDWIGDQVPETGDYRVYKARVGSRDTRKGKSAGYRLLYYVETGGRVVLITIYSKVEQSDITHDRIRQIVKNHEDNLPDPIKSRPSHFLD